MMKTVKNLEARADAAKQAMESEVAKLYEQFHGCKDEAKKAEIKKQIDAMIASAERRKEATTSRVKK